MTLHFTKRRTAAAKPGINTPQTTPVDFEALARFDVILARARKVPEDDSQDLDNQNAYAVGCLAQMVVSLEAKLEASKQDTQAAVQQLHEYIEGE